MVEQAKSVRARLGIALGGVLIFAAVAGLFALLSAGISKATLNTEAVALRVELARVHYARFGAQPDATLVGDHDPANDGSGIYQPPLDVVLYTGDAAAGIKAGLSAEGYACKTYKPKDPLDYSLECTRKLQIDGRKRTLLADVSYDDNLTTMYWTLDFD